MYIYTSDASTAGNFALNRSADPTVIRQRTMRLLSIYTLISTAAAIVQAKYSLVMEQQAVQCTNARRSSSQPTGSLLARDLECDICQEIVTIVTRDLPSDATDDRITNAVDNACLDFAQSNRAKCDTFVEQYEGELVLELEEERDPGSVCASLGVCV